MVTYLLHPQTLFLESTDQLDIKIVTNNPFVQFYVWDFPGDFDFRGDLVYSGEVISDEVSYYLQRSEGGMPIVL